MWDTFVEVIRTAIFGAAHVCNGSLGGGILCVSLLVRIALMPVTLRIARRGREQQRKLALIKNDIELIQKRHAKDPVRLMQETQLLYKQHNIRLFQPSSMIAIVLQAPLLSGLFSAVRSGLGQRVRFAWIADLSRSNATLVVIVAALSAFGAAITPVDAPKSGQVLTFALVAAGSALFFLWTASSAVALSWGGGALITIVQNVILARDSRKPTKRR